MAEHLRVAFFATFSTKRGYHLYVWNATVPAKMVGECMHWHHVNGEAERVRYDGLYNYRESDMVTFSSYCSKVPSSKCLN